MKMIPWATASPSWSCVRISRSTCKVSDTINTQKHLRRVLPIYMIWCPFVDDLGHTSSVTTQDTRYEDRRYWPDQVSQSDEDWVHTFSSTTPGLGVESTPDKVWDYTLSLVDQLGSMPHLSRSIHTKCTSTTGLRFTTHWVKTDP